MNDAVNDCASDLHTRFGLQLTSHPLHTSSAVGVNPFSCGGNRPERPGAC